MKFRILIILFVSILLKPASGYAQDHEWDSLEQMIDTTYLIVRGKVVEAKRLPPSPETPLWVTEDMIIKVSEILKGDAVGQYINVQRLQKVQTSAVQWRMEGSDLILFLAKTGKKNIFSFQYESPLAPINLDHLSENAIVLSNFQVSRNKEEVLSIIKYRIAHPGATVQKNAKIVTIPERTEAFRTICSMTECALIVPADLAGMQENISGGIAHDKAVKSK